MKKSIFIILSIAIVAILFTGCDKTKNYENADAFVEEALLTTTSISVEDLKVVIDTATNYLILDVREPNEHHPGYIPGSVNLPRGLVEFNIGKQEYWDSKFLYLPLKEDLIIVYCKRGKRGILAAATLFKMGYTNVKYIEGGFKQWELTYPNDYDHDEVGGHVEEEVGGC